MKAKKRKEVDNKDNQNNKISSDMTDLLDILKKSKHGTYREGKSKIIIGASIKPRKMHM